MITSINCLNFIAVFKAFRKSRIFAVKKVEESVIGNRYFKKTLCYLNKLHDIYFTNTPDNIKFRSW